MFKTNYRTTTVARIHQMKSYVSSQNSYSVIGYVMQYYILDNCRNIKDILCKSLMLLRFIFVTFVF